MDFIVSFSILFAKVNINFERNEKVFTSNKAKRTLFFILVFQGGYHVEKRPFVLALGYGRQRPRKWFGKNSANGMAQLGKVSVQHGLQK